MKLVKATSTLSILFKRSRTKRKHILIYKKFPLLQYHFASFHKLVLFGGQTLIQLFEYKNARRDFPQKLPISSVTNRAINVLKIKSIWLKKFFPKKNTLGVLFFCVLDFTNPYKVWYSILVLPWINISKRKKKWKFQKTESLKIPIWII